MSAGVFTSSKYAASYDTEVHPIRVQPETIAASIGTTTNAAPTGAVTNPISASVSHGRRRLGLNARLVRLTYIAGTVPTGYNPSGGTITIPALNTAFYNAAIRGAAATYLGVAMTVQGRTQESVN